MKRYQSRYSSRSKPLSVRRLEKKGKRKFIFTILLGFFLLYALLTWILPTLVGGLSVINKFKDAPKATSSIANNATLAPPILSIPYEATNTATISVKGYAAASSTVEIYIDVELKTDTKAGGDGSFSTSPISLNIGTNNISGKTVDEKGNKSPSSKPIRIIFTSDKPDLEISSPSDNQTVSGDKKVTVSGTTNADKGINVTAGNTRLIVNSDGTFSQSIDISEGENNIVITALDQAGNTTQITRKVIYQP